MKFKELTTPTLKNLFVKQIEEKILSGELSIGEKLPTERDLATQMRVSRAVINGGITDLVNKGFLEVLPRKGAYVTDYRKKGKLETLNSILEYNGGRFDPVMLDSILDVRICIEQDIVKLSAKNRTAHDILLLRKQLDDLDSTEYPEELSAKTFEFYHLLALSSGNIVYPLIMQAFRAIYLPLLDLSFSRGLKNERLNRFNDLVDLIERQQPEEAAACIVETIYWMRQTLSKNFAPGEFYK